MMALSYGIPSRERRLSPLAEKRRTASSPAPPLQTSGSRLDKLRKLCERRFKFSFANGPSIPEDVRSGKSFKKKSRKSVVPGMIGFPTDFVHSKHVSLHEVRQMAYQPRHSFSEGKCNSISLFSRYQLSGPDLLSPGVSGPYDYQVPHTPVRISHDGRVAASLLPDSPVRPLNSSGKVKRKSVPIHFLKEAGESSSQEAICPDSCQRNQLRLSCSLIEESLKEMITYPEPKPLLDEKGRIIHVVGGEYMTQTIKAKWDGNMEQVAKSLKMEST